MKKRNKNAMKHREGERKRGTSGKEKAKMVSVQ